MTLVLEDGWIDSRRCCHPSPASIILITETALLCGHCEATLPEVLRFFRAWCDGSVVRVTQRDFGAIHVCGEDWTEEVSQHLLEVSARPQLCTVET